METLTDLMKKVLADTFALYLKTHQYHWNVEGRDFIQLHGFFGGMYEELHGAVDNIAEEIRTLGEYVPGSFKRFSELTEIDDELTIPDSDEMVKRLVSDNLKVIETLSLATKLAGKFDKLGLQNFLADRIDKHQKHQWMLRSISK